MTQDHWRARACRTIEGHALLVPGDRVVVAVSGGPDSVALLWFLKDLAPSWKLTLHVAHLDHGLRSGSQEDAEFVRDVARRWGVPSTIERRDVEMQCAQHGWSLEEGARRVRYAFLLDVARRQSAGRIAVAHTADDQAETMLLRLLRGTGLLGLGAIPVMRQLEGVWVVRPLLEVWRQELIGFLEQAGLTYRNDPTNAERRFTRNRVRHDLLPLLEREYHANVKRVLVQLAQLCRADYAFLDAAAVRQWKRVVKVRGDRRRPAGIELVVSRRAFLRQPTAIQRQLVRRVIEAVRGEAGLVEFRHWLEVERLFTEQPVGTVLDLPGRVQLRREAETVVCTRAAAQRQARDASPAGTVGNGACAKTLASGILRI